MPCVLLDAKVFKNRLIVNWSLGIDFPLKFGSKYRVFFQKNVFEDVVNKLFILGSGELL